MPTKKVKFSSITEYVRHFKRLIEMERKAEMEFHKKEIKSISGEERERRGRALTNMRAYYKGYSLMKHLYVFKKHDNSKIPENEMNVGDVVLISRGNPLKKSFSGVICEKTKSYMVVSLQETLPKSWKKSLLRLDLYCNDITFQRMFSALEDLKSGKSCFNVSILLGMKSNGEKVEKFSGRINFINENLNESQKICVKESLASKDLFLIHGPPGTGKTSTCVEIILQLVLKGNKVLACADSNIAVDNIVERLAGKVNVVRLGHPARISEKAKVYFLDKIIEESAISDEINEINKRIEEIKAKRDVLTIPSMKNRRGLKEEQIFKLARKGKSSRGITSKKIKEMALWLTYNNMIKNLIKRKEKLLKNEINRILRNADVVCTTNSGAYSEYLENMNFDVVVIDEATQATEPSCLMPLNKAPKVVLAGDHKQLPPTVLNKECEAELSFTMFERFMELYGNKKSRMLDVQYRMNEKIMEFPNKKFYQGKLKAHESVKNITILDLIKRKRKGGSKIAGLLLSKKPITFFHVSGEERKKADSKSLFNVEEAEIVKLVVETLLNNGIDEEKIGIITPYKDQEMLLREMLKYENLEIHTVDGFQGREKEIIIISFVRGNEEGNIGFLNEERRFNVAITRAKRKLILVGNKNTLKRRNRLFKEYIDYLKKNRFITKI